MVQLKQMTQSTADEGSVLWVCPGCLAGKGAPGAQPLGSPFALGSHTSVAFDEADFVPRTEYDRVVHMCAALKKQVCVQLCDVDNAAHNAAHNAAILVQQSRACVGSRRCLLCWCNMHNMLYQQPNGTTVTGVTYAGQ